MLADLPIGAFGRYVLSEASSEVESAPCRSRLVEGEGLLGLFWEDGIRSASRSLGW